MFLLKRLADQRRFLRDDVNLHTWDGESDASLMRVLTFYSDNFLSFLGKNTQTEYELKANITTAKWINRNMKTKSCGVGFSSSWF